MKYFSKKVYIHPHAPRTFWHRADMDGWCEDHGEDKRLVETFDSVAEYDRWRDLQAQERAGAISALRRQVRYEIIPEHSRWVEDGVRVTALWDIADRTYGKKKDAVAYCRELGLPQSRIAKREVSELKFRRERLSKAHHYTADFVYMKDGKEIVEDCKSSYTRKEKDYILRRDLMLEVHGIIIYEYVYDKR